MQPLAQILTHRFVLMPCVLARAEALLALSIGHLQQLHLVPSLRPDQCNAAPLSIAQILCAGGPVLELHRQDDLVRNVTFALIELGQQRSEDLLVGKLEVVEPVGVVSREFALRTHSTCASNEATLAIEAEDVLIHTQCDTACCGSCVRSIALRRSATGAASSKRSASAARAFAPELPEENGPLPLQKQHRLAQMGLIGVAVDGQTAGGQTALDLVLEARSRRLRKTPSLHVRNGMTFRIVSSASRTAYAEAKGPK